MQNATPRDNPCYCINLRRAANTLTKFYDEAFAPLQLTANQFSLLNDIQQLKVCNKSELARCAGLDRTTIIRSLGVLSDKGLVAELPGGKGRNLAVRLTPAGEAAIQAGRPAWKQAQDRVKSIIGAEHLPLLKQILTNIDRLNDLDNP